MGRPGVTVMVPRAGEERRPTGEPLSRLWEEFLRALKSDAHAPSTVHNHERTRELARPLAEHPTPREVAAWLVALHRAGLGPGTVRLHRDNLHRVYSYSNDTGAAQGNPVALASFKPAKPKRQAINEISNVWPFLAAVALDARERAFWGVQRFNALRPGEALAVRPFHVQRSSSGPWYLIVVEQRSGASWDTRDPKSEAGKRRLPVRPELQPLLEQVLDEGPAKVWMGRGGQVLAESPYLFPYRNHHLRDQLERLRGVCPDGFPENDGHHVFRHSCAVEMVLAGKTVEQLALFLGHSSIKHCDAYLRGLLGRGVQDHVISGLDTGYRPAKARKAKRPAGPEALSRDNLAQRVAGAVGRGPATGPRGPRASSNPCSPLGGEQAQPVVTTGEARDEKKDSWGARIRTLIIRAKV